MSEHDPYEPLAAPAAASEVEPSPVSARLVTYREGTDDLFAMPQAISERWPRLFRHVGVASLLAAGFIAITIASATAVHGTRKIATSSSQIVEAIQMSNSHNDKKEKCHTAKKGEQCYEDVIYQRKNIKKHPEWFHDLNIHSSFEDFQESLYKQERCPKPCTAGVEAIGGNAKALDEKEDSAPDDFKEDLAKEEATGKCHTAVEGEKCLSAVKWVLKEGIFIQPKWYKGLTKMSRIEDVQAKLEKNDPTAKCPKPCKCHTAAEGEKCHKRVIWVMTVGAVKHPDWYPGLSITSRFEEVQARVHQDKSSDCPMPCTPLPYGSPSLFCFSVVRSTGYEPEIMRKTNRKGLGIFACDEYAVYSDTSIPLGAGLSAITFVPASVGKSKDGTAGNALLFMNVWAAVRNDFRSKNLDWTVKVDPDAVLLPDRLRQHISKHNTKSVYIKNCGAYNAPGWPKLFGALEVFSRRAMAAYFTGAQKCKTELQWYTWGEDLYMERCMDHLGVGNVADLKLASDGACIHEPNCGDGWASTFHPFKSWDTWYNCWKITTR